ncbi:hypothetical protein EUGRSUZ_C00891 [Eucalyptus grandis]|uniref:Uncharacterized protein n=2 Tax=Eucalyptus grandis TaxID=71139 RepID=A0ACC3LB66_EUCGR|nr:hypothetical protein EUGRSUZ_C00891 [Eucalyptus grandis]
MWAFMESWLIPSSLFIVLNIMIGTIFLTSRLSSSSRKPRPHYHDHLGPDHSPPLARTPSLLELVRSIDFSLYKFGHHGGGYPELEPEAAHEHAGYEQHSYPDHGYAGHVDAPPLARAPSLLERVKSIKFSSFYRSSEPDPDEDAPHHLGNDRQVRRVRSDQKTTTPGEGPARRLPAKMKKSASDRSAVGQFEDEEEDQVERRRPETAREGRKKSDTAAAPVPAPEEEDEINAKADAFINRFERDPKLERLDSIMRFKEKLNRGAS